VELPHPADDGREGFVEPGRLGRGAAPQMRYPPDHRQEDEPFFELLRGKTALFRLAAECHSHVDGASDRILLECGEVVASHRDFAGARSGRDQQAIEVVQQPMRDADAVTDPRRRVDDDAVKPVAKVGKDSAQHSPVRHRHGAHTQFRHEGDVKCVRPLCDL
jgi:hypothetical protein